MLSTCWPRAASSSIAASDSTIARNPAQKELFMPHYGMLRDYRFTQDIDDIRGATLYGVDHDKLGKIDDVIFDHDSGTIRYAVVDTGGWLKSKKFLVPADRIRPDAEHEDDFYMDA